LLCALGQSRDKRSIDVIEWHILLLNSYLGDLEPHRIQAVKTGDVMEVISHGAVASPLIGYKHAMIRNGDYSAAFMVAQMLKDLSNYSLVDK
jgi:hypothetical protein